MLWIPITIGAAGFQVARNALQASPVTQANLPTAVTRDWLAPGGQARVSVIPKGDSNDNGKVANPDKSIKMQMAADAKGK